MQAARSVPESPLRGVMHVYAGNRYGGIERMLSTMARAPAYAGQSYALIHRGRLYDELSSAGADVVEIGPFRGRHPWQALALRRRLRAALDARGIHTVIGHMCIPYALAAPAAEDRTLIYGGHEFHTGRHWSERWARLTRRPDAVIAGSASIVPALRTLFPDHEPAVVRYAVELELLPDPSARLAVREELGTPPHHKVILSAARLTPYKGLHVLVEALGLLQGREDWTAWIAGGPQSDEESAYLAACRSRTAALALEDQVRFLGERRDVMRLMHAADVQCQANVAPEPFGICFIEALWAGVPVVTSRIGGALEILTPELGELVTPDDPAALAAGLARALDDGSLRERCRVLGPPRARELCAPEIVSEHLALAIRNARARTGR